MSCAHSPACINDQIVKTGCYCLNESAVNQYTNLFCGDHTLGVRSDSDEQLIIHLAFLQTFKLSSISFGIPGDETCPATVKLFANVNNLGFSDATGTSLSLKSIIIQTFLSDFILHCCPVDKPATQEVQLEPTEGSPNTVTINLQAAKWQRVESGT